MEINDFIGFVMMAMILFTPFIWIYLILYTLNWNERKNLFFDSWLVFLAWIVSGVIGWIVCMSAEYGSYKFFPWNGYMTFFTFTLIANVFSVAAVLKSRENKKNLSIVGDSNAKIKRNNNGKIWQTSVIVSILTLAMVTSLAIFVGDISARIERLNPTPQFGIYD